MQKRIIISILLSVFIILLSLGFISYYHIDKSIKRSYDERLAEAKIIATSIDNILEENLTRLYDISLSDKIDLADGSWKPERDALQVAYEYSIFKDGVFLLDRFGNILTSYPPREGWTVNLLGVPPISRVITDMKPVISNVYAMEPSRRKVVFALVPLRDKNGKVIGAAGGLLNPTSYTFTRMIQDIPADKQTSIDLVDSLGTVIASNDPANILTCIDRSKFLSTLIAERKTIVSACHRCHETTNGKRSRSPDIIAFAPLSIAPWGVSLRVPQKVVFAPSAALQRGFIMLGIIALVTSFILALGMSKSIVKPVLQLIRATDVIAKGNLSVQVSVEGSDEIKTLANHFDNMRLRLAESLDSIQRQNLELEQRVRERTRQLEEKQVLNEMLLRKLITSQEDERKRIARELHDESLQTLSAILMNIDMCRLHPELITPEKVSQMKETVTRVLNEMTKVIQNLRPTVLDDLGFEAGIIWLIDHNLKEKGISCFINMDNLIEEQIPPELQITLFRVFQEATMNIARHAQAQNVFIHIRNDRRRLIMRIEDDGNGFDTASVFDNMTTGRGLGILGMKERVAQVNGTITICSLPGQGTTVQCSVPLSQEG